MITSPLPIAWLKCFTNMPVKEYHLPVDDFNSVTSHSRDALVEERHFSFLKPSHLSNKPMFANYRLTLQITARNTLTDKSTTR